MRKVGIAIFLIGLALTVFTTITFFTDENVVNLGNVEITQKKAHHLDISPIFGICVMGIGGIIFWQTYNPK
jgi:hypothetical protein